MANLGDPKTDENTKLLIKAVIIDNVTLAEEALTQGADGKALSSAGASLLGMAKSPKMVELLAKAGADPKAFNIMNRHTPLHHAETPGVATALIKAGADVNAREMFNMTPIMTALNSGRMDVVEAIAKSGQARITDKDLDIARAFVKETYKNNPDNDLFKNPDHSNFLDQLKQLQRRVNPPLVSTDVSDKRIAEHDTPKENSLQELAANILKSVGLSAKDAKQIVSLVESYAKNGTAAGIEKA